MKIFNNPHFHTKLSGSKNSSLQSSRAVQQQQHSDEQNNSELNDLIEKLNPTKIEDESQEQFEIYQEMSNLKVRVIELLKRYQQLLQSSQGKEVKQKMKTDVDLIKDDYFTIVDRYQIDTPKLDIENNVPSIEKEKELNNMFNLLEEFLERFTKRKATMNYFSLIQQDKLHRNGLGIFPLAEHDGRQSQYDFQNQLPDLSDSNNSDIQEWQAARIALSNSQKLRSQIRRRFFELAQQLKDELPLYHQGRKMLISILFEDAEEEGVDEQDWREWIQKNLLKEQ